MHILKIIWVKVFKNGPSKICRRQLLKNFTWSILEYFVPYGAKSWRFHSMLIGNGDEPNKFDLNATKISSSNNEKFFD